MRKLEEKMTERMDEIEKKIDALLGNESVGVDTHALIKDTKTMDSMGRITIPKSFRQVLGVVNESVDLEISLVGDKIILKKV